jgi:hypothetical protein
MSCDVGSKAAQSSVLRQCETQQIATLGGFPRKTSTRLLAYPAKESQSSASLPASSQGAEEEPVLPWFLQLPEGSLSK